MSDDQHALISRLQETLAQQQYNSTVVHNYCRNAALFLSYLDEERITPDDVTPATVSKYLDLVFKGFANAVAILLHLVGRAFRGLGSTRFCISF